MVAARLLQVVESLRAPYANAGLVDTRIYLVLAAILDLHLCSLMRAYRLVPPHLVILCTP
jgi:hypothetical protein